MSYFQYLSFLLIAFVILNCIWRTISTKTYFGWKYSILCVKLFITILNRGASVFVKWFQSIDGNIIADIVYSVYCSWNIILLIKCVFKFLILNLQWIQCPHLNFRPCLPDTRLNVTFRISISWHQIDCNIRIALTSVSEIAVHGHMGTL